MLKSFFRPRAVAVVGASTQPGKVGYDVLLNLTKYGFKGQVYPINPKADEILGKPCFKSVADLPDDVRFEDTQFYGVGAFLLAATAVADLDLR